MASSTASVFKVKKASAVKLLVALGFEGATNYDVARVKQRLQTLPEAVDPEAAALEDPKDGKLLKLLCEALDRGDEVVIVGKDDPAEGAAPAEESPPKKGKKRGGSAPAEEEPDPEEAPEEEPEEAVKKGGKKAGAKAAETKAEKAVAKGKTGEGVIATIKACLLKASERKPVSKKDILEKLVAKFPDRQETSLMSTVNHQVPSYLRKANNDVRKNDKGYWIES